MAANRPIHGTGVQTCAAADARENFGGLAGEDPAAAVVEQHDVQLLRTVRLAGRTRTANHRGIDGELLPGRRPGKHFETAIQIGQPRHQLFNPHHHHVHPRQRRDHPGVALIGDETDRPVFDDAEVGAGDAHLGAEERVAQPQPRRRRQLPGLVRIRNVQLLLHHATDVLAGQVNDRGNDVRRPIVRQLHDVLAEIGFNHLHTGAFEGGVEMGLFRDHRLALHRHSRARRRGDAGNDPVRLVGGLRPVDLGAVGGELRFEALEVLGEVRQRAETCGARRVAHGIGMLQRGQRRGTPRRKQTGRAIERTAQVIVGHRQPDARGEVARRRPAFALCHGFTPRGPAWRRRRSIDSTPRRPPWS